MEKKEPTIKKIVVERSEGADTELSECAMIAYRVGNHLAIEMLNVTVQEAALIFAGVEDCLDDLLSKHEKDIRELVEGVEHEGILH